MALEQVIIRYNQIESYQQQMFRVLQSHSNQSLFSYASQLTGAPGQPFVAQTIGAFLYSWFPLSFLDLSIVVKLCFTLHFSIFTVSWIFRNRQMKYPVAILGIESLIGTPQLPWGEIIVWWCREFHRSRRITRFHVALIQCWFTLNCPWMLNFCCHRVG